MRTGLLLLGILLLGGCGPSVVVDPSTGGTGGAGATGGSGGSSTGGGGTGGSGGSSTGGGGTGGSGCAVEVCDGIDNDCDGDVDEGDNGCGGVCPLPQPLGAPCDGPDADQCEDDTYACDGPNSVACSAGADNAEICNGLDDDCDGTVDEGNNGCGGVCPLPQLGAPCDGPDADQCQDDPYGCDGPNSVICSTGADDAEVCDGVDNDCDGVVDEGNNGCGGVCPLPQPLGAPCDGTDLDQCQDDQVVCNGKNATTCSAGADNAEICNGLDDDCNGIADDACVDPEAFAPSDCNLDGDDLPPTTCLAPPLGPADTVACVCAAPPCPDPLCDSSHTDPFSAVSALGGGQGTPGILLFAGTYPAFTFGTYGTKVFVGAHCDGGVREPVSLTGVFVISAWGYITIEGVRVESGITALNSSGQDIELRDLVLHGGLKIGMANGTLIEGVEIYPAAGGPPFSPAADIKESDDVVVTRSAACNTTTGWQVSGESSNVEFDRVLAKDNGGYGFYLKEGTFGGPGAARFDRCLASGNGSGIEVEGLSSIGAIEDCQFVGNGAGLSASGQGFPGAEDVPHVGKVWNNLFSGNGSGIKASLGGDPSVPSIPLVLDEVRFNTFVGSTWAIRLYGSADAGGTCIHATKINSLSDNIVAGNGTGIWQRCGSVASASENLLFNPADCDCQLPVPMNPAACPVPTTACPGAATSLFTDPLLTPDHRLSQPPDQASTSPAVDAASVQASMECSQSVCLGDRTTSTAVTPDTGAADLGYHWLP